VQVYTSSKTFTVSGTELKFEDFIIPATTLSSWAPRKYKVYLGIWKQEPDYSSDEPYDFIGPIEINLASEYTAKDNVDIFDDVKILTADGVHGIGPIWTVDIKACFRAYAQLEENSWSWSLYADAYMIHNSELYRDTGKTALEFKINVYDPQGNSIHTGDWISTDTDDDGTFGDFSHRGGKTPSYHGQPQQNEDKPSHII